MRKTRITTNGEGKPSPQLLRLSLKAGVKTGLSFYPYISAQSSRSSPNQRPLYFRPVQQIQSQSVYLAFQNAILGPSPADQDSPRSSNPDTAQSSRTRQPAILEPRYGPVSLVWAIMLFRNTQSPRSSLGGWAGL